MELSNSHSLPVSQDQAWQALNDTAVLREAIPGCEAITGIGDNEYEVLVTAAVGPVKAKFKGKLRLADLQPPTSYSLQFEGQGGVAGHAKGSATVRLEPQGARTTLLHYSAKASVGGKLAQVGSRVIDMAAQKLAGEFFERFTAALAQKHGAAAPPAAPAAVPGLLARLRAWLRRLFGA